MQTQMGSMLVVVGCWAFLFVGISWPLATSQGPFPGTTGNAITPFAAFGTLQGTKRQGARVRLRPSLRKSWGAPPTFIEEQDFPVL